MEEYHIRKVVRNILREYGNIAFHKLNAYPPDGNVFPNFDKEDIKTPSDIDFWSDLEYNTDEDIPISEEGNLEGIRSKKNNKKNTIS